MTPYERGFSDYLVKAAANYHGMGEKTFTAVLGRVLAEKAVPGATVADKARNVARKHGISFEAASAMLGKKGAMAKSRRQEEAAAAGAARMKAEIEARNARLRAQAAKEQPELPFYKSAETGVSPDLPESFLPLKSYDPSPRPASYVTPTNGERVASLMPDGSYGRMVGSVKAKRLEMSSSPDEEDRAMAKDMDVVQNMGRLDARTPVIPYSPAALVPYSDSNQKPPDGRYVHSSDEINLDADSLSGYTRSTISHEMGHALRVRDSAYDDTPVKSRWVESALGPSRAAGAYSDMKNRTVSGVPIEVPSTATAFKLATRRRGMDWEGSRSVDDTRAGLKSIRDNMQSPVNTSAMEKWDKLETKSTWNDFLGKGSGPDGAFTDEDIDKRVTPSTHKMLGVTIGHNGRAPSAYAQGFAKGAEAAVSFDTSTDTGRVMSAARDRTIAFEGRAGPGYTDSRGVPVVGNGVNALAHAGKLRSMSPDAARDAIMLENGEDYARRSPGWATRHPEGVNKAVLDAYYWGGVQGGKFPKAMAALNAGDYRGAAGEFFERSGYPRISPARAASNAKLMRGGLN